MFIEASFNLKIDTTADDYEVAADEERADDEGANSVALVCFHSVAMHDQATLRAVPTADCVLIDLLTALI